ncbi:MAG: O-antigen ligase family protein [Bryobacteraceae bacterium]
MAHLESTGAALFLLALAAAATLAISTADPFTEWAYEGGVFLLAAWATLRDNIRIGPTLVTAAVLAVWGFGQLAAGATVYRYATLNASLRVAALAATALVASVVSQRDDIRDRLLRWFGWFGFLISIVCVVAYYTSSGSVLWVFPSPYPDVWGPFLSRNNFAQFLELAFPVVLWLACTSSAERHERGTPYMWMSATMLACGLVSASRAGAVLLILEAAAVFALARPPAPRRLIPLFAASVMIFAALAGGDVLLHRFQDSDPFRDRREIFGSSLGMIAARPWTGYGLGNFATVYPEFARFDPGAVVEHAHNDWLEWATEGGWPYAAVWMLLAISTLRPAARSIWGIGVLAVFVHALVDYPFARFGVAAWLFILMGALESNRRPE